MYNRNSDVAIDNVKMLLALRKQIMEREECEGSLRAFVKSAWGTLQPGVSYVHGWHIDAICDHLEAVASGEIRKLIINISPRSSKSTIGAVAFPAWIWLNDPVKKFLFSSYDLKLSFRDSRFCRSLVGSQWYQRNWGSKYKILSNKGGQDSKQRFDNDKGGFRIATSTDAGTTGDGGDILFYDDPNDIRQMTSDPYIEQVIYFHEHVMSSRLNDAKTGCRVCIQQRSGERDLTGHILSKELGWEHLVIPMEYEGSKKVTSIGWSDPRKEIGELMWPDKIGPTEIEEMKVPLGSIGWAGQYQQRPSPGEGNKFKREHWNYWNSAKTETGPVRVKTPGSAAVIEKLPVPLPPAFEQIVQSWDMTFKDEKENDFVAGHVWGRIGANTYLLDRVKARLDFPRTLTAVRKMSERYPCPEKLVEDKANGPAVISTLRNEIPGLIAINPEGGKVSRANAVAPYVEAGNVYLPNPDIFPWVNDFIEEAANFPRAKFDDDVDAMTQALRRLYEAVANTSVPEFRVIPREGEPSTARHVETDEIMLAAIPPHWRRWIAVAPGAPGAALWICETPKGSLRLYREMELSGVDAFEAGRLVAQATLPDIRSYMRAVHLSAKWNIDVLLEKEAFTPVEPIGSYAELFEQGILAYDPPEGSWDDRQAIKAELKQAKFSAQMAEIADDGGSSFDRLRDLLRFQPIDYEEVSYDRKRAFELARADINLYNSYMAAVDGRVIGEYPKIKFAASAMHTVAALGAARREQDIADPFLRALMIGISAPRSVMTNKAPKEVPWPQKQPPMRRRAG